MIPLSAAALKLGVEVLDNIQVTRTVRQMSENLEEFLTKDELQTIGSAVDVVKDAAAAINSIPDALLSRRIDGLVTISPQEFTLASEEPELAGPQILKPIGQGAMGEVFLARDPGLQRRVALKQLRKRAELPRHVAARFVSEAQITAQLDHPNIVPVYGLTNLEGKTIAYTMKLVKGRELSSVIAETRRHEEQRKKLPETLSLQSRLEQFLKVCDAVHFAHVKGVIHRDLKPANIMLGEFNEVYVMDWGLARLFGPGSEELEQENGADELITSSYDQSVAGSVSGTLLYMSPEQARGENLSLDPRSDQYTLGLILAELVYLQPARRGGSPMEILARAALVDSVSLTHAAAKRVPKELVAIIRRAAAFDRGLRYATVAELAADVRRYLRGEAIVALKDSFLTRVLRWIGQHRLETLLICFGLVTSVCLSVVWDLHRENQILERSERRQAHASKLVATVAGRANDIERHFLTVENRAETILSAAESLLGYSQPSALPLLTTEDFAKLEWPPDVNVSTVYSVPVSIERPVAFISKNSDRILAAKQLATLAPLNAALKRAVAGSAKKRSTEPDSTDPWNLIATAGTPIRWATIGLESGALLIYPGNGEIKEDYDARLRPWYQVGAHMIGKHWGSPYLDLFGQGLLLPCASSIYSPTGEFLGVMSIDLTFQDIAEEFMKIPDLTGFQEAFLLNSKGEILVRSKLKAEKDHAPGSSLGSVQLVKFPFEEVLEQMRESPIGYHPVKVNGKHLWIAYSKIEAVDMYYVAIVDVDHIGDAASI